MKFRQKPIIVEAVQWFKMGDSDEVRQSPDIHDGEPYYAEDCGLTTVHPGDWIVNKNCPPVVLSPAEFAATYEPMEGEEKHEKELREMASFIIGAMNYGRIWNPDEALTAFLKSKEKP